MTLFGFILLAAGLWNSSAFVPPVSPPGTATRLFNFLGDLLSGPKLESERNLPYDHPLCSELSCSSDTRTFASKCPRLACLSCTLLPTSLLTDTHNRNHSVKERAISFTGEDFDITEITNGHEEEFVRVRGAMLHLPGKDKMRMTDCASNEEKVVMDRVLIAATPSYDLYRSDGTKIGWMEKKLISLGDCFDVYMEGKGGFGELWELWE